MHGLEYFIIDSIQDFRAEDSFIHRKNKLAQCSEGTESPRKHVGTYTGRKRRNDVKVFFDYADMGDENMTIPWRQEKRLILRKKVEL